MRRSLSTQETLSLGAVFVFLLVYLSLSDIYYYLPPFFGLSFLLFAELLRKEKRWLLVPLILFLLFFEAGKGYLMLSSIIYFALFYWLVLPLLNGIINCSKCLDVISIFAIYLGFYLFTVILHVLLSLEIPEFSNLLLYYALLESLLVLVLL